VGSRDPALSPGRRKEGGAMLRGNSLAKLDEKGRLKLPAVFRALLEPKFGSEYFVTSLRGDSVRIYAMDVWLRIEERLARASSMNPSVMRFKNAVNYFGQSTSMDTQGRILIHPLLRDRADVRGEVVVLGQQDFLEVWNRNVFEARLEADPLTDADLGALSDLGI
jgi:MraZ protein